LRSSNRTHARDSFSADIHQQEGKVMGTPAR
jgi:hypothetical protein